MKPFTTGRVYVNFIGDEGEERVIASFGRDGYRRLQAIKDRYDPENLFRASQNIKPSLTQLTPSRRCQPRPDFVTLPSSARPGITR